jgi:hypothetical protein
MFRKKYRSLSVLNWNSMITPNAALWLGIGSHAAVTADNGTKMVPKSGYISNLAAYAYGTIIDEGENVIITIQINGLDTSLSVTLENGDLIVYDNIHKIFLNAGDRVSVHVTGTSDEENRIMASVNFRQI